MLNGVIHFEGVKIKASSLFRFVCDVFGTYLLNSNFDPVLYAASDHSIHSNCTETHLICKTRLLILFAIYVLIRRNIGFVRSEKNTLCFEILYITNMFILRIS